MTKPFRGTIHQWKKSPTPGYGLGYLLRGHIAIEIPVTTRLTARAGKEDEVPIVDLRSATGYVIAFNSKTKRVETETAIYTLGEPFEKPIPYDPNDYDEEKGLTA